MIYNLNAVTKLYPGQTQPANDQISFTIHAGEIFGLLGDNGAGKSTLVKQMMNLERSSGEITFNGRPINDDPLRLTMQVGYMPQSHLAINQLTVGEAIYFTAHLRGLSRRDALAERERLLALGPVLIPPEKLPPFMYLIGYLSPATYAASALRQTLLGGLTLRLWLDLAVLSSFCLFSFWLTGRKMDWRQD